VFVVFNLILLYFFKLLLQFVCFQFFFVFVDTGVFENAVGNLKHAVVLFDVVRAEVLAGEFI